MAIVVEKDGVKTEVPQEGALLDRFSGHMKPMIILPPDAMSDEDIQMLRNNGLCVVKSKIPANIKFIDPIPSVSCRTQIEDAAIKLSKMLVNGSWTGSSCLNRSDFCRFFMEFLVNGTPLDPYPKEEQEKKIFDNAKAEELRRLAREEARAERAAKKKAESKKAP